MTPWSVAFGSEVVWQVILTGFSLIGAVLGGVLAVQGRARSPVLVAGGAVAAAALVAVVGEIAALGFTTSDPAELELASVTFAVVHLIGPLTVGPVALATLGLAAFAGLRDTPRHWRNAVAAYAVVVVVAAVVIWGGFASANPLYAVARSVAYLAVGAVAALACCAGGEDGAGGEGSGPVAAGVGGAVFPLVVAVGEASERGLVYLILTGEAGKVAPERWPTAVEQMLALVESEWLASRAAVVLALGVAAVGVFAARRLRGPAVAAALLSALVAGAVLVGADLGPERAGALAILPPAP